MSVKTPQEQLHNLLQEYLAGLYKTDENEEMEMEVRFGTRGIKPITRNDYDNVIKKLKSNGFRKAQEKDLLRIQTEYIDPKTTLSKISNIRVEIEGIDNIRNYCKTDNIEGLTKVNFIQKQPYINKETKQMAQMVNNDDYNFRASLSTEKKFKKGSGVVRNILEKWSDSKKVFRYISRYSMQRSIDMPFYIDLSIVKESRKRGKYYVPEYNIKDSGVFNAPEHYEIEIEFNNKELKEYMSKHKRLEDDLKTMIKYILCGLQDTNYPVSYKEQSLVLQNYMKLLWGADYKEGSRILPKNFVGPSSYTLDMPNIMDLDKEASSVPNIRKNYTVTDKADGDRKLLYIADSGKIYLINTNMNAQFTGNITTNKEFFNSLLDGEHILHDASGYDRINLYAAFDLYYLNGKDIRNKAFIPPTDAANETSSKAEEKDLTNYRLPLLNNLVHKLDSKHVVESRTTYGHGAPLNIQAKEFYSSSATQTIFQACKTVLDNQRDMMFPYKTDGLIFTPSNLGVGASESKPQEVGKPIKTTWDYSFKWKPPQYNTIDFLVSTKKDANGADLIGNLYQEGTSTYSSNSSQINQYKTLILRVGFDEKKHGYINPCQDIIEDKLPSPENMDDEEQYKPVQFFPTNPSDPTAGICNIMLRGFIDPAMTTEEGETIEDNMIVEFRYDLSKEKEWRWIPLRVRYDKTAEFRAGLNNFGNAYHVANSNWKTIHNPISEQMLSTGEGIPTELVDDDVYYNRVSGTTKTRSLRDFHNLYVKNLLISNVSKKGDTLIDLAVGKGGDLPKWINSKLKFVFGIDISRDNIQNRLDGACARFINYKKKFKVMPDALFVNGNSSVNIRSGEALYNDKDKQITKAVFGEGAKDVKELGKGVYKEFGIGSTGFDVCSIQFAIHYMFENIETLHSFLRNVSEVTKVGGYFIGTSYDGKLMFDMLKDKQENESISLMEGDKKIWEVTKRYDRTDFEANSSCVGFGIDVYQESINKTFKEYLVNYDYLTRMLENYGFVLLTKDETTQKRLPGNSGTGLFSELFSLMNNQIKANKKLSNDFGEAPNMTSSERTISFLNRYFVYKKVRNVDAHNVMLTMINKPAFEEKIEAEETKRAQIATAEELKSASSEAKKKKPVKLKAKLKLVE